MGSNEDVMHDFVRKELKRFFSTVDGWQMKPAAGTGQSEAYVVNRRILGRSEGAYIIASFEPKVSPGMINALDTMAVSMPIGGVTHPRKIIMVPQNADVSGVPKGVDVLTMKKFGFEGNELVWLKRFNQVAEKKGSVETA
jgi:hypothetical protein